MPTDITMPQLGESVTEGTVGRWLKKPGEQVEKYEPLLEVITDKVDSEVPSPAAGVLLEIVVAEGTTVRVGTVLARVGAAQEQPAAAPASAPATPIAIADAYDVEPGTAPTTHQIHLPAALPVVAPQRQRLTPVVARMAAEHQLDLRQIVGTGANGRVSKQDVLRYLTERSAAPNGAERASPVPPAIPVAAPIAVATNGAERAGAIVAHTPPPPAVPAGELVLTADQELTPLTAMRRAIANHMVHSMQVSPQVTNVFEVDLSQIVAHREQHKGTFERQGTRLTYTAYFFHATVAALQAVPMINARYTDQGIVLNKRIHIGMAVALDQGLIVPVLKDADEKNLLGLARAVNDLAERARSRQLKPDETQGGTFTISNHGTGGSLFGTPVINQPQSAILGVGAMVKRPVVISQGGQDMIAIRPISYLSLTFDHRLIDGGSADAFLTALKQRLENYR
jgi:2-oxoisovalerate dehydrogenase E2 component (dihydrolipoyl transacylase)